MSASLTLWAAVAAAGVQGLIARLHHQGQWPREAFIQLLTSALAGALPNLSGLPDLPGRELMVAVLRTVASLGLEERHTFMHVFDALLSDTTGLLLYYQLSPLMAANAAAVAPTPLPPTTLGPDRMTGSSVSSGAEPPRPGNSTSAVTPSYMQPGNTTPRYNPWLG